MANVICYIVNPTAVSYDNVNAAGDDIPAYSMGKAGTGATCTLSDAEVATFVAAHPTALIQVTSVATPATEELRRIASKILRLGKFPSTAIT